MSRPLAAMVGTSETAPPSPGREVYVGPRPRRGRQPSLGRRYARATMPSRAVTSSAYAGRDDLLAMESLVSAAWASPARPLVNCTIGDLEWWIAGGGPDVDWSSRIRLWSVGGDPVAWGWFSPPASLEWFVRPGLVVAEETAIRDEILAWHGERARAIAGEASTGTPL